MFPWRAHWIGTWERFKSALEKGGLLGTGSHGLWGIQFAATTASMAVPVDTGKDFPYCKDSPYLGVSCDYQQIDEQGSNDDPTADSVSVETQGGRRTGL